MFTNLFLYNECHFCGKAFTKEKSEEIYTISNLIALHDDTSNRLHWRWVRPDADEITSVFFVFHKECFKAISGDEYLSKGVCSHAPQEAK